MKSVFFIIILMMISHVGFSQFVIVETGRPKSNLDQQAHLLAGEHYKITFKYVPFKHNKEQLDSIKSINAVNEKKIIAKYGQDWRKLVQESANNEIPILNKISQQLNSKHLSDIEDLLIFSKSKCGKIYTTSIYKLQNTDKNELKLIKKFKVKKKNGEFYVYYMTKNIIH